MLHNLNAKNPSKYKCTKTLAHSDLFLILNRTPNPGHRPYPVWKDLSINHHSHSLQVFSFRIRYWESSFSYYILSFTICQWFLRTIYYINRRMKESRPTEYLYLAVEQCKLIRIIFFLY